MEKLVIEKNGKKDVDFDRIKWALRAVSTDDARPEICGINVSYGVICATNGHRMHLATTDREIPDGTYTVKSATKKLIVLEKNEYQYPDYERCIPKVHSEYRKDVYTNGNRENYDMSTFLATVYMSGQLFNVDYLTDAYMDDARIIIDIPEGKRPAVFVDGRTERLALVMPMAK
jgi:DNA polymerase III sliding clamp (beta) subunit (PCNA family)